MSDKTRKLSPLLSGLLIGGTFVALLWWERRRPLRRETQAKPRHDSRNLAVAGLAALTVQAVERPVTDRLTALVVRRRWGLLQRLRMPARLETALAVVLLDYTLYVWHYLTHRVPFLWRFHLPHHVDLDLDASTALRFHFGELALSVGWRAAQVVVIGASPRALSVWQILTLMEILFHHSNVELPEGAERWLSRLVVTPRLHGIHHSAREGETNSNWSSGLTAWDWLHGTLRRDVPQGAITVGVPAYRRPGEVTLPRVLAMPFGPQRPTWEWPGRERSERQKRLAQ